MKKRSPWFSFVLIIIVVVYFTMLNIICISGMESGSTIKFIADAVEILIAILVILYFYVVAKTHYMKKKDAGYKNSRFEILLKKVGLVSIVLGLISILLVSLFR